MKKDEIRDAIQDVVSMYGNKEVPIEAIADVLKVGEDEARIIYDALKTEQEFKAIKKKRERPKIDMSNFSLISIRAVMGAIGIGACIMSCYYTSIWLYEFLPKYLAIFLSFLMVVFSVSAFQLIIHFWQNTNRLLISVFGMLWIIVAIFSMGSTVAGQYNTRIASEKVAIEESENYEHQLTIIELLREEENTIKEQISEKMQTKSSVLNLLEEYKDTELFEKNKPYYNDLQWRMSKLNDELNLLNVDLRTIQSKIRETIIENPEIYVQKEKFEIRNFYMWMSEVINADKDSIQFWLSVFPALFIDIIAPTGVAVSLYLRKRKTIYKL